MISKGDEYRSSPRKQVLQEHHELTWGKSAKSASPYKGATLMISLLHFNMQDQFFPSQQFFVIEQPLLQHTHTHVITIGKHSHFLKSMFAKRLIQGGWGIWDSSSGPRK